MMISMKMPVVLSKNLLCAQYQEEFPRLKGSLPKSGPLDFATKNSFPLFFAGEEALVGIYQNRYFCFQILFLTAATSQKQVESVSASQRVFERLKLMDFERRAGNKRLPAQKSCSIHFFKLTLDSSQIKYRHL